MSIIAQRFRAAAPSATVQVFERAFELKRQGKPVIALAAGEPDFDTPENVRAAAMEALNQGKTRYAPVPGIMELREAICAKLQRDNGLTYSPGEISVGSGAKQSIFSALMATLEPGDEVIIPTPFWVSFADIALMMGAKVTAVDTTFEDDFKLTPRALDAAITPKTKWVILCTPSNPTGAVYSDDELRALAKVLERHPHVWVMTDHIYEKLVFEGGASRTIAEVDPAFQQRSVIINGVSKGHCMTGWRIGYIAGPKELIGPINAIQSQVTTSACTLSQWAAIEALNGDQSYIEQNNLQFKRRRDLVVEGLNAIDGIECRTPRGAFYVYASMSGLIGATTPDGVRIATDTDFVDYLLREALVAVIPGAAFHLSPFFRLTYSASLEALEEALQRMASACAKLT
ncbi:MAG: aminotransferase class I/II-fold pyridoxal phosphate-dependent enzyme [Phenylobacterium sp.]|uniref:pyridoxal phosphate-dependent aminotransferase n=1 Tax=Phenylobacterium sp. TaxID=1871053 RepID=UPI0025F4FBD9|nr:pyridoxal phosphate-dependent aminotransferase [Phenylobacterium sp.]MBI1200640.1 aminotransferase class I/II-fold pyridoxal phosphate-dependent enzyme [Phenylobacterium sp.]